MMVKGNNTDLNGWPTWGKLGFLPSDPKTIVEEDGRTVTISYSYSHVFLMASTLVLIFISILLIVFSIVACVRAKVFRSCCFGKTRYQKLNQRVLNVTPPSP